MTEADGGAVIRSRPLPLLQRQLATCRCSHVAHAHQDMTGPCKASGFLAAPPTCACKKFEEA